MPKLTALRSSSLSARVFERVLSPSSAGLNHDARCCPSSPLAGSVPVLARRIRRPSRRDFLQASVSGARCPRGLVPYRRFLFLFPPAGCSAGPSEAAAARSLPLLLAARSLTRSLPTLTEFTPVVGPSSGSGADSSIHSHRHLAPSGLPSAGGDHFHTMELQQQLRYHVGSRSDPPTHPFGPERAANVTHECSP